MGHAQVINNASTIAALRQEEGVGREQRLIERMKLRKPCSQRKPARASLRPEILFLFLPTTTPHTTGAPASAGARTRPRLTSPTFFYRYQNKILTHKSATAIALHCQASQSQITRSRTRPRKFQKSCFCEVKMGCFWFDGGRQTTASSTGYICLNGSILPRINSFDF